MLISLLASTALAAAPALFGAQVVVTPASGSGTDVKTGDINGDGVLDITVSAALGYSWYDFSRGYQLELSLSDGVGGYTSTVIPTSLLAGYRMVTDVGDLNDDGYADLVAGHAGGFSVFFSDGTTLASEVDYAGLLVGPVELGDVDGDGDLDLVTLDDAANANVYHNDGYGGFTLAQAIATDAGLAQDSEWDSLDLRDLDLDGVLDLTLVISYATSSPIDPLAVYIGDGAGGFGAVAITAGTGTGSVSEVYDLALGDLNSDGLVDFLFAGAYWEAFTLPFDSGFGATVGWPITSIYAWNWVLTGDIDGDGDDDAVGTVGFELTALVQDAGVLTDPGASFTIATISSFVVADDGFELVDMNGDGCADFVSWVYGAGATIMPATSAVCTGPTPYAYGMSGGGDTGGGDTGGGDTGGGDTGTEDTGTVDTGGEDTSVVDTGTADTSTADTSADDTSADDTATVDSSEPSGEDTFAAPPPSGMVSSGCGVTDPRSASLAGLAVAAGLLVRRRR